jgi:hypothetical protein
MERPAANADATARPSSTSVAPLGLLLPPPAPPPLVVINGLAIAPARVDVHDGNGRDDG